MAQNRPKFGHFTHRVVDTPPHGGPLERFLGPFKGPKIDQKGRRKAVHHLTGGLLGHFGPLPDRRGVPGVKRAPKGQIKGPFWPSFWPFGPKLHFWPKWSFWPLLLSFLAVCDTRWPGDLADDLNPRFFSAKHLPRQISPKLTFGIFVKTAFNDKNRHFLKTKSRNMRCKGPRLQKFFLRSRFYLTGSKSEIDRKIPRLSSALRAEGKNNFINYFRSGRPRRPGWEQHRSAENWWPVDRLRSREK